jgi:hypothetical protein
MKRQHYAWPFLLLALVACQHNSPVKKNSAASPPALTAKHYKQHRDQQALILMSINWGAKWRCANYDNALLQSLRFERLHMQSPADELIFNRPVDADARPKFVSYALLVNPGEYALSGSDLLVRKMGEKEDQLRTARTALIVGDQSLGGTFTAQAGEQVYIGNFWIDCKYSPIAWRYYTEGQDSFNKHLSLFMQDYPFLELQNVQYRLFNTEQFGLPYQLP